MQAISTRAKKEDSVPRLSLYNDVPVAEANLDELEQFGLSRLHGNFVLQQNRAESSHVTVLKEIDTVRLRGGVKSDFTRVLKDLLTRELPFRRESVKEDVRKDQLSHFVLRLALRTACAFRVLANTQSTRCLVRSIRWLVTRSVWFSSAPFVAIL